MLLQIIGHVMYFGRKQLENNVLFQQWFWRYRMMLWTEARPSFPIGYFKNVSCACVKMLQIAVFLKGLTAVCSTYITLIPLTFKIFISLLLSYIDKMSVPLKMEVWLLGPFQVRSCPYYEMGTRFNHNYLPCWIWFALIYSDRSVTVVIMSHLHATKFHNESKSTASEF